MNNDLSTDIGLVSTIIDISNNTEDFTFPDIKHDCSNSILHNITYVLNDTYVNKMWIDKEFLYKTNHCIIWNEFMNIRNIKSHNDDLTYQHYELVCCGITTTKYCCIQCLCFIIHSPKILFVIFFFIAVVLLRIYILQ
jgi:hypothetical protein